MSRADYEIRPEDLRQKIESQEPFVLLDVRRPDEVAIAALPMATHIPIEEIEERVEELDPGAETVVYCHHGVRSAAAVEWLRQLGFPAVNLRGGIDAWAAVVDPGLRRY